MTTDMGDTIAPNSDQLDAIDLLTGPRTFTITKAVVTKGAEQPAVLTLAEFDRPWKPGLSMRRVLVYCWGKDSSAYVGRRVRLYCDPNVRFGNDLVGGTRIEALSDIKGPQKVPLLVSRGKSATYTVKPLTDEPSRPAAKTVKPTADSIIKAFDGLGVTAALLEWKVGSDKGDWTDDDIASLAALGKRIKAGDTTVDAEFNDTDGGAA